MKAVSTRKILAVSLSFITLIAYADIASSASLAGTYKCQRSNGSNTTAYTLTVASTGDTYTLEWDDHKGSPDIYGTGIVDANNTVLSSSYWNVDNTENGIESLAIKSDGSMQGSWVSQSSKDSGTDICTKG